MNDANVVSRNKAPSIKKLVAKYQPEIKGVHDACLSVPRIRQGDFQLLVQSIQRDGLMQPILIDEEGLLIDGRCRLQAMHAINQKIPSNMIETTDQNPWAIADSNIARRHLTRGQKALRALKPLNVARLEADQRKREGARKGRLNQQKPLAAASAASGKRREPVLDTVAKDHGLSRTELRLAEKIHEQHPDLAREIERGAIELGPAAESVGLKPAERKRKAAATAEHRNDAEISSSKGTKHLTPARLEWLRLCSAKVCEQAEHGGLTQSIQSYLRACEREEPTVPQLPSLSQLARYCQCREDTLRRVANDEPVALELEAVAVIAALAGIYPFCERQKGKPSHRDRIAIAEDWLAEDPTTRGSLSVRLSQKI